MEGAGLQMKLDANAMLAVLDTHDAQRAMMAGAAVMGGALGWAMAEGQIEEGRCGELLAHLVEIAEEFARAEAMKPKAAV